jgi:putative phosphoesterase
MIFVLSDTHVPERMRKLPQKFLDQIKSDDIIFHAGDFVRWEVFQKLDKLAKLHAVFGNMDDAKIRRFLPQKKVVEVAGKKIGLCHGSGSPFKLWERVHREFKEKCDVLIFGHSHTPHNRKIEQTLLFNPGSLSGNMAPPFDATYGVLTIEGNDVWGEIFELK